jgi:hypothetical protein
MSLDALEVRAEMEHLEWAVGPEAPPEVAVCRLLGLADEQGEHVRRLAEDEIRRVPAAVPPPAEEDGVLGSLSNMLGAGFLQGARFALAIQRLAEGEDAIAAQRPGGRFSRQPA